MLYSIIILRYGIAVYMYTKQQSSCARATVNNTIFIGILCVFSTGRSGHVRQRLPVHCRGRRMTAAAVAGSCCCEHVVVV